jgi:UDP:flavonoid glycosyltransferase YjiC (YdhE family)
LGAGLALEGAAEPATIRAAVSEILGQPSYAKVARELSVKIKRMPGAAGAADRLERLATTSVIASA